MATYIFAAPDSSAADRAAASAGCLYDGNAWTTAQKEYFANGGNTIELRPGTYAYEGTLTIGPNTTVRGSKQIPIPAKKRTFIAPDPATMAVLTSKKVYSSETMVGGAPGGVEPVTAPSSIKAVVATASGASNVTIQDLFLQGYSTLNLPNLKNSTITRVVINNYHGTYPNGSWANMGFGATGAFWLQGSCSFVTLNQCISQYSSHHGFLLLNGGSANDITLNDCRALSSGCGMIRTGTQTPQADLQESLAVAALKFRQGRGYMDWSVGFDLNESGTMRRLRLNDCYAYDSWKVGFYQEPGRTNYDIVLTRCVAEECGQRATVTITGSNGAVVRMIPRESEASNYYLQNAILNDCVSRNGLKAGYDLYPELAQNSPRFRLTNCVDCGSRYGIICGPGAAGDVQIDNFLAINNTKRALNLFGSGPYTIRSLRVKTQNPSRTPIMLGRYCRANLAMSLSSTKLATFEAGLSIPTSMDIALSGTVEGLNAGVPLYEVKNSGATTAKINLQHAISPLDSGVCEGEGGSVIPPGDEEPGIAAAFTATPTQGTAPLEVQFTDQSDGATAWAWNFGDGNTSTVRNPVHVYRQPGTYPVSLTVSDGATSDTETRTGYIKVYSPSGGGEIPIPPSGKTFRLSEPRLSQAYDGQGAIVATLTIRIDEGA